MVAAVAYCHIQCQYPKSSIAAFNETAIEQEALGSFCTSVLSSKDVSTLLPISKSDGIFILRAPFHCLIHSNDVR